MALLRPGVVRRGQEPETHGREFVRRRFDSELIPGAEAPPIALGHKAHHMLVSCTGDRLLSLAA